jgi:hypothetical protein
MASKINFNCSIDNNGGIFVVSGASHTPAPGIQGIIERLSPFKPELQALKGKNAFSASLEKVGTDSFSFQIQGLTLIMKRDHAESVVGASLMQQIDPTQKAPIAAAPVVVIPKPIALPIKEAPTPAAAPVLSNLTILKGVGLVSGLATYYFSPMYGTALIVVSLTSLLSNCFFNSEEKAPALKKDVQNIDQVTHAQLVSGTAAAASLGIIQ